MRKAPPVGKYRQGKPQTKQAEHSKGYDYYSPELTKRQPEEEMYNMAERASTEEARTVTIPAKELTTTLSLFLKQVGGIVTACELAEGETEPPSVKAKGIAHAKGLAQALAGELGDMKSQLEDPKTAGEIHIVETDPNSGAIPLQAESEG